jgi:hypothetical protein
MEIDRRSRPRYRSQGDYRVSCLTWLIPSTSAAAKIILDEVSGQIAVLIYTLGSHIGQALKGVQSKIGLAKMHEGGQLMRGRW